MAARATAAQTTPHGGGSRSIPKRQPRHRCASSGEQGPEMSTSWPLLTPTRSVPTSQRGALGWSLYACPTGRRSPSAELDGVPVATGYALLVSRRRPGCSVYIGGIAVIPAARRRGYRRRPVELAPGSSASKRGPGSPISRPIPRNAARVYERLGFEDFRGIDIYGGAIGRACHCLRQGCGAA